MRYKQTVIGIAWALIRPFLMMVVFTVIFGRLAKLPSDGSAPYALMVFAGMLYRLYATTRKSSGEMIRKLSVIRSRKRSHFLGTVRLRKRRIADLNCAKVS